MSSTEGKSGSDEPQGASGQEGPVVPVKPVAPDHDQGTGGSGGSDTLGTGAIDRTHKTEPGGLSSPASSTARFTGLSPRGGDLGKSHSLRDAIADRLPVPEHADRADDTIGAADPPQGVAPHEDSRDGREASLATPVAATQDHGDTEERDADDVTATDGTTRREDPISVEDERAQPAEAAEVFDGTTRQKNAATLRDGGDRQQGGRPEHEVEEAGDMEGAEIDESKPALARGAAGGDGTIIGDRPVPSEPGDGGRAELPENVAGVAGFIVATESRLSQIATFAMPQEGTITRHGNMEVDELEALLLGEPSEGAANEAREQLIDATGRAAYEIGTIAVSLLDGVSNSTVQSKVIGNMYESMFSATLQPLRQDAQVDSFPRFTWRSDKGIVDKPSVLSVQIIYGDAEPSEGFPDDYEEKSTVIRMIYHLLPGGEVLFMGTEMEYRDSEGEIDYSQQDALLTAYLDQASDAGISLSEASDAFRIATVLSVTESAYTLFRATQKEENQGLNTLDEAADMPEMQPGRVDANEPDADLPEIVIPQKDNENTVYADLGRLLREKDEAVQSMQIAAEIAQIGLKIQRGDEVSFGDEKSNFVAKLIPVRYIEESADGVTTPVQDTHMLFIFSKHSIPYPDAASGVMYLTGTLEADFTFDLPSGPDDKPVLVDINGKWLDMNGQQSAEVKDAYLSRFLTAPADGEQVAEEGKDQDIEKAVMAVIAAYKVQQAEFLDESDSDVKDIREDEVEEARKRLLVAVGRQLYKQTEGDTIEEQVAYGNNIINMLLLAANASSVDISGLDEQGLDSLTDNDPSAMKITAARAHLQQMIEEMPDLPDKFRAEAYFIEDFLFGDKKAEEGLVFMLEQEMEVRRQDEASNEPVDNTIIETVIQQYEKLGEDPRYVIEAYGGSEENKWRLSAHHVQRAQQDGKKLFIEPEDLVRRLRTDSNFSEQFVYENTTVALFMITDAHERTNLISRFLFAQAHVNEDIKNFGKLVRVAQTGLKYFDTATRELFDELIEHMSMQVLSNVMPQYREDEERTIERQKYAWNVRYKARSGDDPQGSLGLIGFIDNIPGEYQLDRSFYLDTAAEQYIARGDYAAAIVVISQMPFDKQAAAYVKYWGEAKTSEELKKLSPPKDELTNEIDPSLEPHYETAVALHSGDPDTITDRAVFIATRLGQPEESIDDVLLGDKNLHWQQLEQLVEKMEAIEGTESAQELSRNILFLFTGVSVKEININVRETLFRKLAKTGVADAALVQNVITGSSNETQYSPEIITILTEFGFLID